MKKRLLPSLLALCLLIGMMPTAVFAADDSADSNPPTVYEGTEGGALETEQEGDRYLPDSEQPDPTLPGLQAEPTAEADADNWLNGTIPEKRILRSILPLNWPAWPS